MKAVLLQTFGTVRSNDCFTIFNFKHMKTKSLYSFYNRRTLKTFVLGMFFMLAVQASAQKNNEQQQGVNKQKTVYTINNKEVTEKEFTTFLAELKQIDNTWYCDETINGGNTGFEAKHKDGTIYKYVSITDHINGHSNSLTKKVELK